jgi:proteasome lid subunit RPN8/RPN11
LSLTLCIIEMERIHAHLCAAYPEEGCGALLGRDQGDQRRVESAAPLDNTRADQRGRRYLIAPEQFLAAERRGRAAGLDVVGFYHSHPDHPAEPSAYDLEHAWPFYTYLIVCVRAGCVEEARAWRLAEDRSRFEPEAIETSLAQQRADAHPAERGGIQ